MQNQSSFFIPFADGALHHRKSSPVVQFSIGALVVEVSTVVVFRYAIQHRRLAKTLPQPSSTPKYRSHSELCMTEKLPTGVLMDDVVIPCSKLAKQHVVILASRSPRTPPNIARTAGFV